MPITFNQSLVISNAYHNTNQNKCHIFSSIIFYDIEISCCSVCYRTPKQFDRFLRNLLCIFGWCQNRWRLFFTTLSDNSDSINMAERLPGQLVCYIFSGLDFEVWRPWAKCSAPPLPNYFPNKMYNIFRSSFLKIDKNIFYILYL